MLERHIILPEAVYKTLVATAEQQGLTPADWIASQLFLATSAEQPLSDLLADLIGAIDSQAEPHPSPRKTPFGEGIATKLAQQGIRRP